MADVDSNLVREIATQVLAALRGATDRVGNVPVEVHAPMGECTGDYSKFPELRGVTSAPAPVAATSLKGVITVTTLRGIKGAIRLAKGAILTPLAQDYIREQKLNVMSDETATPMLVNGGGGGVGGGAARNGSLFWWIDGQCPSVAKVIEALRPNVLASREKGSPESLRTVVKALAGMVRGGRVSGGLLFVGSAARAVCFANRCTSLRAIVGTNDKAVSEGIELLGANVLVIEYPMHGFKSMMGMVKPFAESVQTAPAGVQRELDELRTCG